MTDTDPTNLHALETGYDHGYDDALVDVNRQLRDAGLNPDDLFGDGVEARTNPYTKLFDDRREYVEQQVREAFTVVDEDGDDVFEQTDFIDAILDAHADWMTAHQVPSDPGTKPEPVQVDDWPTVDDENAAQNEIARAVVSAALALGISHIKLSTRYDIASRVVNEIQARFR